jgi:hypothetical protein
MPDTTTDAIKAAIALVAYSVDDNDGKLECLTPKRDHVLALYAALKAYDAPPGSDERDVERPTLMPDDQDIMKAIVDGVKSRDHKMFLVPAGEEISDAILDEMDAAGYVFACAPAADENGMREFYFVANPVLRYSI